MATSTHKKPLKQQPAFKKLRDLLKQTASHDLLWCHRVGECVDRLFPKEQGRQYGENRMTEIAEALGDVKKFYNAITYYRKFFFSYKRSEVKRLSDPSNTRDFPISWTHIKWLLTVEEKKERDKFLNKCCREKLSADQLRRVILQTQGRKSKGGKPFDRPKTLDAGLVQMNEECRIWIRRHRQVWFDRKIGVISEGSRQENLQQLLPLLDEAIENWKTMDQLIQKNMPQLEKIRKSMKKQAAEKAKKASAKRKKSKKVSKKKR